MRLLDVTLYQLSEERERKQPDASEVFLKLSRYPPLIEDDDIKSLEKFVLTLYDRSSKTETVDDVRLEFFFQKAKIV